MIVHVDGYAGAELRLGRGRGLSLLLHRSRTLGWVGSWWLNGRFLASALVGRA